ncbi:16S rRNA (cytidine(1402)-2'-O)-methyltransferase [Alteribacillus sp. HJP-4]|uniref:16S rRNA (cytidine(1402)-2'-O)-methyltransferase n=1 Tax=Alteribacillus sp. HJP-4 TaxID=2775394 RepID=UPI0035CD2445
MKQQKSFQKQDEIGSLYLIPTPIGNLEDMTFRAVRLLNEVDTIFAEDTRQTRKLCTHFDITAPMDSYHEHNKEIKEEKMIALMLQGKNIALVSDAGMPLLSDPGREIVQRCIKENVPVIPLPGANAALTSLSASGLGGGPFYFYGFLPRKKKERGLVLEELSYMEAPLIFYEAPHRLKETVKHAAEVWGERKAVLARELTKKYEEFLRGTLPEIKDYLDVNQIKGECCLIVEGGSADGQEKTPWWEEFDISSHVNAYMKGGMSSKEAIKLAAKDRGVPKREVYAVYHEIE